MRWFTRVALVLAVIAAPHVAAAQKCGQPFEVPASMPREAIAKTLVDQMFDEIVLTDTQQAKAVQIVSAFMEGVSKVPRDASDRQKQIDALKTKRNTDLMALLTKDADKAKLSACFKKMDAPRGGSGGSAG
jgi:Spy/CpxP family protein refolding chaperone